MKFRNETQLRGHILRMKIVSCDGCWVWLGSVNDGGYGRIGIKGSSNTKLAHRVSFELFIGPIRPRMTIDHLCRVHGCVNPAHMEVVTQKVNVLRGVSLNADNARKTHCVRGHPFDASNTYFYPNSTSRACRICHYNYLKQWRQRRKKK
jgi:hypothetical protein